MAGELYALPFRAEDLAPGERLSTWQHKKGVQGLGKDITVRRHTTSGWSSLRPGVTKDKNESRLIYGKPFYAMADGVVVAGWRNAPENPGPNQTHEERGTGRIGGGGNCLWVLQDDGIMTLYAHAIPGSIPRDLCPIDAELLSGPKSEEDAKAGRFHPESVIPPHLRARVRKGQLLGRCGNSGRSGGPHLHVHMEVGKSADGSGRSEAHPMTFERGLVTPRDGDDADIDVWDSFAGSTIPDGEVLIWPPRSLRDEYARHGFDPEAFSRMFLHLADSGYQPEWFDGYRVAGKVWYNFVWRPASASWLMYRGLSSASYNEKVNNAFDDGYSPIHVESYLGTESRTRYAVVMVKDGEKNLIARHGLTVDQHQEILDEAKRRRLSPVAVSPVSVDGNLRYTVLYRPESIGQWSLKSQIRVEDFQEEFDAMKKEGLSPHYVAAYRHGGKFLYSVIFAAKDNNGRTTHHGLTAAEYQEMWQKHTRAGKRTQVITGYDGAQEDHRYVAVWR